MLTRVVPRLARLPRLPAVLTWPASPQAYARLVDPLAAGPDFPARIVGLRRETPRAVTVVLRPGTGWPAHRPGQWVAVGVDIDGVRHTRCYSITSVPGRGDGCVTITVQAVPDGVVSTHLTTSAGVGDLVHLGRPDGDFVLDDRRRTPRLFITGGSGITPVMGMLRSLAADRAVGDAVLVHHAPTAEDVIFAGDLEDLARRFPRFRPDTTLTGTGAPPPGAALGAGRLDRLCPDWRRRETWVCGPAPLLDAAGALWSAAEVTGTLHVERFTPRTAPPVPGATGTVSFAASARTAPSDGCATLLDLAEGAGLAPASGCRMGVCRRCVAPLRSGTVRDLRDGRTESEPGTHIQICVSAAQGDVELDL